MAANIEPYAAQITPENPACVLVLVDQSKSMTAPFGQQPDTSKAEGVATAINRLLANLVLKSTIKGGIGNYMRIGVMGFGSKVGSIFSGQLDNRELIPVSDIAKHPLRIDERIVRDGNRDRTIRSPVWVEPRADGNTPMADAFTKAHQWIKQFLGEYPHCFPPTVVCITDGMPTHVHPGDAARRLCDLHSSNGNVLLFNVHITEANTNPISFPVDTSEIPDDKYARFLYRISSVIPTFLVREAIRLGYTDIRFDSHGFIFNGDMNSVIKLLSFGSRTENRR